MEGGGAWGGVCVWLLGHSTQATSDVLCGAVVANSAAGGAAGGAGGVAIGWAIAGAVIAIAVAVATPPKVPIVAAGSSAD